MKKKSKKEKKPRKKNFLNELETVTFEQQILDYNRQLARLRTRNEELEAKAEKLQVELEQLEESKADLTTYLQEILERKNQEAQELQERVKALEKLRKEEQLEFKKREETLEQEFKLMEKNLTAEIKLAAGKLNALEDWRLARIDLMKKFEDQEKRMAEQEIRHKETLYETEKKLIISKAKMQSELEKRLDELAESFRNATSLRLADATHRAVRENLALRRELDELVAQCAELDAQRREYEDRERDARLRAELHEAEAKLALEKVTKQRHTIELLQNKNDRASRALNEALRAATYANYGEQAKAISEKAQTEVERKIQELEQELRLNQERVEAEGREAKENCAKLRRLEAVLDAARRVLLQAFEVQTEIEIDYGEGEEREGDKSEEDACSSCLLDVKEKLLHSLYDILSNDEIPYVEEVTEYGEENLYEFGNLGIIPGRTDQQKTKIDSNAGSEISGASQIEEQVTTSSDYSCLCSGQSIDSQSADD